MADPTARLLTFRSFDGYLWYYRRYAPAGRPRGRVVFLHGIRSHGGWYTRSCDRLAADGYEVYFLDRRGAGLNTAHRGDSPNFRRLLDDAVEFVLELRQTNSSLPVFLAGISWGGKLAVGLEYRRPGLTDGLMLLCPGLVPKVAPPLTQRISIARARVRNPAKRFPIPLNDPDLFTASPAWQAYIAADRLGLREATARFLFSSFSLDMYLKRAAKRVMTPTLLLLAEHDRVIDNRATGHFLESLPAADKTVIEYPGAHHTLEFEPDGHPFLTDMIGWMGKRK